MGPCHPLRTSCPPATVGKRRSLKTLVAEFLRSPQGDDAERTFFREMPSLELAIHHAATATWEDGKRFRHQNLITRRAIPHAKAALNRTVAEVRACSSFHELHILLEGILEPIKGLGPLYIYDAAARLGYYLSLAPEYVYLHCGSREGAKALGLDYNREYLEKHQLPDPLRALSPAQTESFLCVYKDAF